MNVSEIGAATSKVMKVAEGLDVARVTKSACAALYDCALARPGRTPQSNDCPERSGRENRER